MLSAESCMLSLVLESGHKCILHSENQCEERRLGRRQNTARSLKVPWRWARVFRKSIRVYPPGSRICIFARALKDSSVICSQKKAKAASTFTVRTGLKSHLLLCLRTCRWPAAPCEKQPESDTSTQLGSFMLIVGVKWSWDVCRAPSHPSIRVSSGFMFSLRPRVASRGTDHLKMPLLLSVVRSFVAGQSKMSFQPDTCRGSTGD